MKSTFKEYIFQKNKKLLNLNTQKLKCISVAIKHEIFRHIKSWILSLYQNAQFKACVIQKKIDVTEPEHTETSMYMCRYQV